MWGVLKRDLAEFVTVVSAGTGDGASTTDGTTGSPLKNGAATTGRASDVRPGTSGGGSSTLATEAARKSLAASRSTYTEDISAAEAGDFALFKAQNKISQMGPKIAELLGDDPTLSRMHNELVPQVVDYDAFWLRYLYRLSRLHKPRAGLELSLTDEVDDEEDEFAWEDDGPLDSPPAPPVGQGGVSATITLSKPTIGGASTSNSSGVGLGDKETQQVVAALREENALLSLQLKQKTEELREAQEHCASAVAKLAENSKQGDNEAAALRDQLQSLAMKCSSLEETNKMLQQETAAKLAAAERTEVELRKDLQRVQSSLEGSSTEQDASVDQMREQLIQDFQAKMEELRKELDAKDKAHQAERGGMLERHARELEEMQQMVSAHEHAKLSVANEVAQLDDQLEEARTSENKMRDQLVKTRQNLTDALSREAILEERIRVLEMERQRARDQRGNPSLGERSSSSSQPPQAQSVGASGRNEKQDTTDDSTTPEPAALQKSPQAEKRAEEAKAKIESNSNSKSLEQEQEGDDDDDLDDEDDPDWEDWS